MVERSTRALRATLTVALLVLLVGSLAPRPVGGWFGVALVQGTSMLPLYETGDLVVAVAAPSYEVGDVVVYETGRGRVIHRIVGGDAEAGFVTQGDNRDVVDEWTATPSAVIGRPVLHLPGLGTHLTAVREQLGPNGLTVLAAVALTLGARPRSHRRKAAGTWRPGSREVALAAAATSLLSAGGLVLSLRHDPAAWTLPVAREAVARIGYVGMLLAAQATVAAVVVGRSGHVRVRTWATDLLLGSRIVDVAEVPTAGRVLVDAATARELRTAADRTGTPVLRTSTGSGPPRYAVVTSDLVVRFTPTAPPAIRWRQRTEPA